MAKLVDAKRLERFGEIRAGSTPAIVTFKIKNEN